MRNFIIRKQFSYLEAIGISSAVGVITRNFTLWNLGVAAAITAVIAVIVIVTEGN